MRKRNANPLFALATLHAIEARTARSAEARVCESPSVPLQCPVLPHLSLTSFKVGKYNDARQYVHLFGQHLEPCPGHNGRYTTPESRTSKEDYSLHLARQINLLPIEFEAKLHVPDEENACNAKFDRLSDAITKALKLNALAKTYELLGDMILCSVLEDQNSTKSLISADTAAKLLRQLISATRGTEGYDIQQASRWIRSIVQLVVSASEQGIASGKISLMEEVIEQATVLATIGSSRNGKREELGKDAKVLDSEPYPAEELEWLAPTLFNLAVDYYVADEEGLGKKWARKAVKFADVLAMSRGADGNEELLASVLKEKMIELG